MPFNLRWHVQFDPENSSMTDNLALLSLLDGPRGSDPGLCVIWNRFRHFPADWTKDAFTVCLLDYASTGSRGHGPIQMLATSASEIGFSWDSEQEGWI